MLLKGGHLVDPIAQLDEVADILIEDGVITAVGKNLDAGGAEVVELAGRYIVPGLFDMHVHLREPGFEYKETIQSGTKAAVNGGFTAVCPMANTNPIIDDGAAVSNIVEKSEIEGYCRVWPFGAITKGMKGKQLAEMGDMLAAGAVAFSDDGHGVQDNGVMRNACDYAKMFGVPLVCHSEDLTLVGNACVNEGVASTILGMEGSPALGEALAVMRDIEMARLTGCAIHICHVSSALSVDAIRRAKSDGLPVTAEVTPHHLILSEDDLDETYNTALKVNPPLRGAADRAALVQGLIDGTIDCVASDHAPHAPHEKEVEFDLAAFGTVGLETSLPLILTHFVHTGLLDMSALVQRMAHAPRRILGLEPVTLAPNSVADLTVIDLNASQTVTSDFFVSKSKNSAFINTNLKGSATDVMIDGQWVKRDGKVM